MKNSRSEFIYRKIKQKAKLWKTFYIKKMKSYQLQSVIVLKISILSCYFPEKVYKKPQLCYN